MAKTKTPKTDAELREDLRIAQENYDRTKGYHTARTIQELKKQLDIRAVLKRRSLRVVTGDEGSHDYSDVEIMGKALAEIQDTIGALKYESEIPGILLHCFNVSKHAIKSLKLQDE